MSQFSMQLPGASKPKPPLNIYTGLLFLAVVTLALATAFVYQQATLVAPEQGAMGALSLQQEGSVRLPNAPAP
ncbi:MAG: hypothetical protein D6824_01685 [Planctomycetota bacterium]|nr:MAG: hypothetical protein D6824_01685 [Planctomycetota bacterium]